MPLPIYDYRWRERAWRCCWYPWVTGYNESALDALIDDIARVADARSRSGGAASAGAAFGVRSSTVGLREGGGKDAIIHREDRGVIIDRGRRCRRAAGPGPFRAISRRVGLRESTAGQAISAFSGGVDGCRIGDRHTGRSSAARGFTTRSSPISVRVRGRSRNTKDTILITIDGRAVGNRRGSASRSTGRGGRPWAFDFAPEIPTIPKPVVAVRAAVLVIVTPAVLPSPVAVPFALLEPVALEFELAKPAIPSQLLVIASLLVIEVVAVALPPVAVSHWRLRTRSKRHGYHGYRS